jgi:hypothetical protein
MDTLLREIGVDLFVPAVQNYRNFEIFCASEWITRSWQLICSIRFRKSPTHNQDTPIWVDRQIHASKKHPLSSRWGSKSSPPAANHYSDPPSWQTVLRDTALFIKESRSTIYYSQVVFAGRWWINRFHIRFTVTSWNWLPLSCSVFQEFRPPDPTTVVPSDLCPVTFSERSVKEVP